MKILPDGALIHAYVGISQRDAALRIAMPSRWWIPEPKKFTAMIDTGCTHCMIDPTIGKALSITPIDGSTRSLGDANKEIDSPGYAISLGLHLPEAIHTFPMLQAGSADFRGERFKVIIGRDVLDYCIFLYNGKARQFVLEIPYHPSISVKTH